MENKKPDGGPAFPVVGMSQKAGQEFIGIFESGMSLRDWFAGMALIGLREIDLMSFDKGQIEEAQRYAAIAYLMADAMLKAREK